MDLSNSEKRNKLIVSKLEENFEKYEDFRCVVFSRFKDHNQRLFDMINLSDRKFIIDGNYTKTNSYVIENLPDKYIIFTTYSQFSTGIDVPGLNSIVIALPTKSKFDQTLGRIM